MGFEKSPENSSRVASTQIDKKIFTLDVAMSTAQWRWCSVQCRELKSMGASQARALCENSTLTRKVNVAPCMGQRLWFFLAFRCNIWQPHSNRLLLQGHENDIVFQQKCPKLDVCISKFSMRENCLGIMIIGVKVTFMAASRKQAPYPPSFSTFFTIHS